MRGTTVRKDERAKPPGGGDPKPPGGTPPPDAPTRPHGDTPYYVRPHGWSWPIISHGISRSLQAEKPPTTGIDVASIPPRRLHHVALRLARTVERQILQQQIGETAAVLVGGARDVPREDHVGQMPEGTLRRHRLTLENVQ